MKRFISLTLILCFLLCSCQLKVDNSISTTENSGNPITESTFVPLSHDGDAFMQEDTTALITQSAVDVLQESTDEESSSYNKFSAVHTSSETAQSSVQKTSAKATEKPTVSTTTTTKKQTTTAAKTTTTTKKQTTTAAASQKEIRGVWLSYLEFPSAKGKSESQYRKEANNIFSSLAGFGINTVFLHARAFSDAFYLSDIFPTSKYVAGTQGAALSFDPFKIMLESAKSYGLEVHAWINPFRVSSSADITTLSKSNPARKIYEAGNEDSQVCILSNGIYYNPASLKAQQLVLDGIKEILANYAVAGIHIDDYFYPSTDKSIDSAQYEAYTASGGKSSLAQWRISTINAFVSAAYSAVKSYGQNKIFSISPAADIEKNRNQLYADVKVWLANEGYADWIIPQIYYGFENSSLPFDKTADKWNSLKRHKNVKLICGLAAYKCGTQDAYAGNGKSEWLNNSDILLRQTIYIETHGSYNGIAFFSCNNIINPSNTTMKAEIQGVKNFYNGD